MPQIHTICRFAAGKPCLPWIKAGFVLIVLLLAVSSYGAETVISVADAPPPFAEAKVGRIVLEMSPKPFYSLDEKTIRSVATEIFRQWSPLIRHADSVAVLLWTADGSEILEYRGHKEDTIEWARYIGYPNARRQAIARDKEEKSLHAQARLYRENPPVMTYGDLAAIVRIIKEVGGQMTGKPIQVGATFDPGGEFARSPFKYEKHNEICLAGTMGKGSFVGCYATLNADSASYAGFPNGIPQGMPLGTFLGRQSQHFLTDLGFDYIWLSNGFGFGVETWKTTGPLFDGSKFDPAQAKQLRDKTLEFWRLFRAECPKFPIETRGTNLTTGIGLASNAVPLREIYAGGFDLTPPPNSPWAAINGDFGLEMAGHMSRIAELPEGKGYPFRFYVHDPWWLNSPWLDRYAREPHDIYLPLSIGRISAQGKMQGASSIALLTIDDSYGRTPEKCPNEITPHILTALEDLPDRPGPLVWVYPFDEYHEMAFSDKPRLELPFFADWLIRAAINNGLPLNTVVSSTSFLKTFQENPALYRESVLITTVPDAGSPLGKILMQYAQSGGRVLLYGPLDQADPQLRQLLHVGLEQPIAGKLKIDVYDNLDRLSDGVYPSELQHRESMSAGGCREVFDGASKARSSVGSASADAATVIAAPGTRAIASAKADPTGAAAPTAAGVQVLAAVSDGASQRVAAVWRKFPQTAGALAWVRGTNSNSFTGGHLLTPDDPKKWFQGDLLMRFALDAFGYRISVAKQTPGQRNPVMSIARHDNGFFFSGYTPNTNVELRLQFPQGAPLLSNQETRLVEGRSCYRPARAWHRECRVFVEQREGEMSCNELVFGEIGVKRRLLVNGLSDATLRFYPEPSRPHVTMQPNPREPFIEGPFLECQLHDDAMGHYLRAEHISGSVLISW